MPVYKVTVRRIRGSIVYSKLINFTRHSEISRTRNRLYQTYSGKTHVVSIKKR